MNTDRWEILVTFSDGQFKQVSYVNGICTSRGGKHVDYVVDQIVDKIASQIAKKNKDLEIKAHQIKQNLFIFINSLIVNPTFDSQTKETLTTKSSLFGSKPQLSEKFIKQILKTGIIDQIVAQAITRQNAQLAKTLKGGKKSRISGIPKLEDANDAGTSKSDDCTLILTEGDSAKALAMAGIEVVGRDKYGVFPLKGKLLNVREASISSIKDNAEIQSICKIVGLDSSKPNYENVKSLRYGSIMIMADQDSDGSHIKGLVINFINYFWPSLFKMRGFLKEFITPIIKVSKGTEVYSFFTLQEFKEFAREKGNSLRTYHVKYYKGLGTSSDLEAKEYFSSIEHHQIEFIFNGEEDLQAIELGFSRKKIEQRKTWLADYNPDTFVDYNVKSLSYSDFINLELIHFSNADNLRSIPSFCDGLKPGQRKILFSCFKRNLRSEIKVAQLIGYVAEHSAYHHGEQSLASTIVGMAQTFVGSNNINLLMPIGQFGSRNQGGKEHASARYIFTNLSKVTRALFIEHDDHVLKYLEDDNQMVEPEWYLPIIPMCLVNGTSGIGTGWSTDMPNYSHREIVQLIKSRLEGKTFREIRPWYKGFQGEIEDNPKGGYFVKGRYEVDLEEEIIQITELPIGKWTRDYKNFLEEMINPPKGDPIIEDIKEHHKNNRVHFEVQLIRGKLAQFNDQLEKILKLISPLSTNNIVMFTPDYKLKRYSSTAEILEEFFLLRLKFYEKRKDYLVSKVERDVHILQNKMRFITQVIEGTIELRNVKKKNLLGKLVELEFTPMSKITKINSTKMKAFEEKKKENSNKNNKKEDTEEFDEDSQQELSEDEEATQAGETSFSDYNYLLTMPIFSLTNEKVESLRQQLSEKQKELLLLKNKSIELMWNEDLDAFVGIIDEIEEQEEKDRISGKGCKQNGKGKPKRKNNQAAKEKGKKGDENMDSNIKSLIKNDPKTKVPQIISKSSSIKTELQNSQDKVINKKLEQKNNETISVKPDQEQELLKHRVNSNLNRQSTSKQPEIPKQMKQMTLMDRLQQKFEAQGGQSLKPGVMNIEKRKKDLLRSSSQSKDMPISSLKKKKNKDNDDEDFDLDLDFLEPSKDIMNLIQKSSEYPMKRSTRSNGKPRQIYDLYDEDSEKELADEEQKMKQKTIDSDDEEFVFTRNIRKNSSNSSIEKDHNGKNRRMIDEYE